MNVAEVLKEADVAVGKYLTFVLADESYGIEILRVQEIVGLLPVTRVPRMPASIAGVVNLRGRVIPVVDLRLAFGMPAAPRTDVSCIIVVRVVSSTVGDRILGVIVDEVSDVVAFTTDRIEETPEFGSEIDTSFIRGVGRIESRVVLLLDIDKALSADQMAAADHAVSEAIETLVGEAVEGEKHV